jgi:hypothetical protein
MPLLMMGMNCLVHPDLHCQTEQIRPQPSGEENSSILRWIDNLALLGGYGKVEIREETCRGRKKKKKLHA